MTIEHLMSIYMQTIHVFLAAICLRYQHVLISVKFAVLSIFKVNKSIETCIVYMKLAEVNKLIIMIQGYIGNRSV